MTKIKTAELAIISIIGISLFVKGIVDTALTATIAETNGLFISAFTLLTISLTGKPLFKSIKKDKKKTKSTKKFRNNSQNNWKTLALLAGFFIVLLLMTSNVLALGVTPGRTTLDFEPGLTKEINLTIINSERESMRIILVPQGDLAEYIKTPYQLIDISPDEERKSISYIVSLPYELPPGLNTGEILIIKLKDYEEKFSEATIGATVGVAVQLYVRVPYPGKYAEASLNIVGPDADGKITFVIPVVSRGELDLVRVRGSIEIYGPLNERIDTIHTNEIPIPGLSRKELVAEWIPDIGPGKYRAVATILYDENVINLEAHFNIGSPTLEIIQIEVNDFRLGEIAKFEMLVENKWSEPIKGAFAEMEIYNPEGKVMADVKSPVYDISPLERGLMVFFWDTAGVRVGTYDSLMILKYGQHSDRHDLNLEVSERNIRVIGVGYVIAPERGFMADRPIITLLVIIIVLLILINALWFLFLRRKISSKKAKPKNDKIRGFF